MATALKNKKKSQRSLPSLLRYFEGMVLTIEAKNGRQIRGKLLSADQSMNLTLEDAVAMGCCHANKGRVLAGDSKIKSHGNSSSEANNVALAMVHIRGSTIRYIHFPDNADLTAVIKQGMDRERAAAQKYQRGVRKAKK